MISLQTVNRLKFTERRPDGTDREFKSHEMGMQVSCSMDTEMQAEGISNHVAKDYLLLLLFTGLRELKGSFLTN